MKKFFKVLFYPILWIWQLPQHIGAVIVFLANINHTVKRERFGITYYVVKHIWDCGVSLGNYIFLDSDTLRRYSEETVKHEHGHSIQSKIFGPTYLIFVGLLSFCGNVVDRIMQKIHKKTDTIESIKKRYITYYRMPWEWWADKFGKVNKMKRLKEDFSSNDNTL